MIRGDEPIVAGTCRFCGCQEEAACPGGCSWTDESRTLCTTCLNFVTVAMALVDALGVVTTGPRALLRRAVSSWQLLPLAAQRALVAAVEQHLEDVYDDIAQSIMDEATLETRAIEKFMLEHIPEELATNDESLSQIVLRLLEPYVRSGIIPPAGAGQ